MGKTDNSAYIEEEFSSLIGKTVVGVRELDQYECDQFLWSPRRRKVAFVLELNDGSFLVPSSDPEGNDPGHLIHFARDEWMA